MENGGADVTEKKGQSDATLNRDLDAGLGSVNPHEGFDEVPRNLENEDLGFLFNLTQVPCFRDTMLYAMPSAAVLAAFRLYRLRDPLRAADLAVKSFTVFTLSGWFICRFSYRERRNQIQTAFEERQRFLLSRLMLQREAQEQAKAQDNSSTPSED